MTPEPLSPHNPDFAAVVRESFTRQAMMTTLGATLTRVEPGAVDISAPFAATFTQQNGFWHAGAVSALADSANGYAAFTLAAPGTDVLAVEFKINLLTPALGERFLAEGRVIRPGRTLTVCQAEVFGITGSERNHVATLLSTLIIRPIR